RVIATFTGAPAPVQLSGMPADPTSGRARVSTSAGGGSLRIDGYTAAAPFATYTTRDVPVAAGHVWIASGQKVRLVQSSRATHTGELAVAGSSSQTVRGTAACDAFGLQRGAPVPIEVPGNGRVYASRGTTLDLYDQPGGSAVLTLRVIEGSSHLFW